MDNRPDNEMNGVELNEAADIMESSPEALRKRIQRGSLQGYKVDGRWYVVLPDGYERPDDIRTQQDKGPDTSKVFDMLMESKDDEIAFLRQELAARTEEIRRRDHIIAGLQQRIPELPEVSQTFQEHESIKRELFSTVQQEIAATQQRLDQRLEEHDRVLLDDIKSMLESRQEQQQKKSFWQRLSGK